MDSLRDRDCPLFHYHTGGPSPDPLHLFLSLFSRFLSTAKRPSALPLFSLGRGFSRCTVPSVPAASLAPPGPQSPRCQTATTKTGDYAGLPKETALPHRRTVPFSRGECDWRTVPCTQRRLAGSLPPGFSAHPILQAGHPLFRGCLRRS